MEHNVDKTDCRKTQEVGRLEPYLKHFASQTLKKKKMIFRM